jgi:hypothetical protein
MSDPVADSRPEFSRVVEVERLGAEGIDMEIEADADERAALARRFGLVAIGRLAARVGVRRIDRRLIRVRGRLEADVTHTCVVTLEAVPEHVEEGFVAVYGDAAEDGEAALAAALEAEEDLPEPLSEGGIDVGETVAQHLALALDPYPRAPGAEIPAEYAAGPSAAGGDKGGGPFRALGRLTRASKRGS